MIMTICLIFVCAVARSEEPLDLGAAGGLGGAVVGAGGIVFCTAGGLFTCGLFEGEDWTELCPGVVNEQASNKTRTMANRKRIPLFIITSPPGEVAPSYINSYCSDYRFAVGCAENKQYM